MGANRNHSKPGRLSQAVWLLAALYGLAIPACSRVQSAETDSNLGNNSAVSNTMSFRWEKQQKELEMGIVIQVSKMAYRVGERIEGEVLIRNDSRKSLQVYVPGVRGSIVRILKPATKDSPPPVSHPMIFGRTAKLGQADVIILEPWECFGRKFHVDGFPGGEFKVSAFYAKTSDASEYVLMVESPVLKVVENR